VELGEPSVRLGGNRKMLLRPPRFWGIFVDFLESNTFPKTTPNYVIKTLGALVCAF